jgi:hypothetical protein
MSGADYWISGLVKGQVVSALRKISEQLNQNLLFRIMLNAKKDESKQESTDGTVTGYRLKVAGWNGDQPVTCDL